MKTVTSLLQVSCLVFFLFGCYGCMAYDHENPQAYDQYWRDVQGNSDYIIPPRGYIEKQRVNTNTKQ